MQHDRPRPLLTATVLGATALLMAGCSGTEPVDAAAATSSQAAALSSAAQASPGDYGTPVDPDLPNPTEVATDPPAEVSTAAGVSVVVTYAGWVDDSEAVEVGAFVPGVVENGGTCTLTLTGTGSPVTTTSQGEADADSTSCATMSVPGSDLRTGTYSAVVEYRSTSGTGSSGPMSVDVP